MYVMSSKKRVLSPEELMEKADFSIKMLSPCGIFCGLCPQFTKEKKKCHGCYSGKGFARLETKMCGILKCCKNQEISRCNECNDFPDCEFLQKFTTWDSFVTHALCIDNLNQLNELGEEGFLSDIKDRVEKGEFPPAPRPGGMKLENLKGMMKPPHKSKKSKSE